MVHVLITKLYVRLTFLQNSHLIIFYKGLAASNLLQIPPPAQFLFLW